MDESVKVVKKADGGIRITQTYRLLNAETVNDAYLVPIIEDLFHELSCTSYFTKLDCFSGFY